MRPYEILQFCWALWPLTPLLLHTSCRENSTQSIWSVVRLNCDLKSMTCNAKVLPHCWPMPNDQTLYHCALTNVDIAALNFCRLFQCSTAAIRCLGQSKFSMILDHAVKHESSHAASSHWRIDPVACCHVLSHPCSQSRWSIFHGLNAG